MNYIAFIGQNKPDRKLIREILYRYHPDETLEKQILSDLQKTMEKELIEPTYVVKIDIKITVKEYGE